MIESSLEISCRYDFSLLCNARGVNVVAEVGTDRGVFAREFLSRWNGERFYCIDPYLPYDEMNWPRTADRMTAVVSLAPYLGRVRFLEILSPRAYDFLEPHDRPFPGMVYIDGGHDYERASTDITFWWKTLTPSGILAGHDYDDTHPGVVRAVREFAERENVIVRTTRDPLASWYAYKVEPPRLMRRFFDERDTPNRHVSP